MENEVSDSSSSSGDSAPLIIMPPPPRSDYYDVASGLNNPSNVRNLKDILDFTTKMTDNEDDVIDISLEHEKREFLKNVLSTMSVNVHEEINNSINILLDPNKEEKEYNYAFIVLGEYVDSIDFANDFQKLGGFQIFTPCLSSVHTSVRCKTAELIATVVQHNAYCQEKFIDHPTYINILIDMVEKDKNLNVRIKALHAISCLIRHNDSVFWKFVDLGGDKLIVNAVQSTCQQMKIKAAFLILATSQMDNSIAELYVSNGVVEIICTIIMSMEKSMENYHHELFLTTLNQLLQVSPAKVKEICSKFEELKETLLSLQRIYNDDSNFQDEKEQITWLMESLTINE